MRDVITIKHCLSLAGPIHKMIPVINRKLGCRQTSDSRQQAWDLFYKKKIVKKKKGIPVVELLHHKFGEIVLEHVQFYCDK